MGDINHYEDQAVRLVNRLRNEIHTELYAQLNKYVNERAAGKKPYGFTDEEWDAYLNGMYEVVDKAVPPKFDNQPRLW